MCQIKHAVWNKQTDCLSERVMDLPHGLIFAWSERDKSSQGDRKGNSEGNIDWGKDNASCSHRLTCK